MPLLCCSEDEYRALPHPSYSTLKHAQRSAAHMRHAMDTKVEPSAAMTLGSLVDCMLFAPDELPKRFFVMPEIDRRTKDGKKIWEELQAVEGNKRFVSTKDFLTAEEMVSSIRAHPTASAMLKGNRYQIPMQWEDPDTGVTCKALADSLLPHVTLTDLKTAMCADWREFSRSAANLAYHMQAAMYVDGFEACTGESLPYTFIVVENSAPHAVAVYRLDETAIRAGRQRYKSALALYKTCVQTGVWSGYATELQTLDLPRWALGSALAIDVDDPF
jgi:hypothetical protein